MQATHKQEAKAGRQHCCFSGPFYISAASGRYHPLQGTVSAHLAWQVCAGQDHWCLSFQSSLRGTFQCYDANCQGEFPGQMKTDFCVPLLK